MPVRSFARLALVFLAVTIATLGQKPAPDSPPPQNAAPQSKDSAAPISKFDADPEVQLQKALAGAGNDRAALVRNLKDYLRRFPDAPRKAAVYRALVESCQQIRDDACALDYAEQFIAVHPDDSEMMLLAVHLLREKRDDASLTRASGYVTRVLDRVEKSTPGDKPARSSQEEWQAEQNQLRAALYEVRGQIERSQHSYDTAVKDLQQSYSIRPNAMAAQELGEICEMRNDFARAIEQYTLAFVLPENGPAGKVDRREVRRQLGNAWRRVHGSEQGLGEQILLAYDRLDLPPDKQSPADRNKNAKDTFAFVLRNLDGTPLPLAPLKGKVIVLSFWATWCGPCRELEPVFIQVAKNYAGNSNLMFYAVNTDEDEAHVPEFVAHEKWDIPVVFADGLDDFMTVATLPTVLVLDPAGKITFRVNGFPPDGFAETLTAGIQDALAPAK
jgi:thiol-disulfide isomerase/thioredoxin